MIGDTKETLSAKTDRDVREIYDDEVTAVVIHGDDIDSLEGWQWDLSRSRPSPHVACCTNFWRPSVFSKEEIVFARTSPQHKLEIGNFVHA